METRANLAELPDELLLLIVRNLSVVDQYYLKQSCRRIYWSLERYGIATTTDWTSLGLYFHEEKLFHQRDQCELCGEYLHEDEGLCKHITYVAPWYVKKCVYYLKRKNTRMNKEETIILCKVYYDTKKRDDLDVPHPHNFDWRTFVAITHMTNVVSYHRRYCPEIIVCDRRVPDRAMQVLLDSAKHNKRWSLVLRDSMVVGMSQETWMMLARNDGLRILRILRGGSDSLSSVSDQFFEASRSHLKELSLTTYLDRNLLLHVHMKNVTDASIDIWNQYYRRIFFGGMVVTNCTLNAIINLIKCMLEKKSSLSHKYGFHFGFVCVPFRSIADVVFPFEYTEEEGLCRDMAVRTLFVDSGSQTGGRNMLCIKDKIQFGMIDTCCSDNFFLIPCTHNRT